MTSEGSFSPVISIPSPWAIQPLLHEFLRSRKALHCIAELVTERGLAAMSADAVGLTVRITLKPPRNWVFEGLITSVVDQKLELCDVYFPDTNTTLPTHIVLGAEIEDLEVLPARKLPPPPSRPTPPITLIPSRVQRPAQRPAQKAAPFVDPAILSFTRNANLQVEQLPILQPVPVEAPSRDDPLVVSAELESIRDSTPRSILKRPNGTTHQSHDAAEVLGGPVVVVAVANGHAQTDVASVTEPVEKQHEISHAKVSSVVPVKVTRERRRKSPVKTAEPTQVDFVEIQAPSPAKSASTRRKKTPGWRQTPLLEQQAFEEPTNVRKKDNMGTGRKTRRQREQELAIVNGWATEDATDIQELGDFDFEGNLSKFDKRSVFDQLRIEDTTADEERLVSFNRALPGTFGGKNLHPSENVLAEPSQVNGFDVACQSDSEAEEGLEGSTSSRMIRPRSRTASRQGALHVHKGSGTPPIDVRRPSSLSVSRVGQLASRMKTPRSHGDDSVNASLDGLPSLKYISTGRVCAPATPEALDAIEAVAKNISGLSEDILSENAGRCIAEVALAALNPGGRRLTANHNAQPVVVVLVGDNRAGARALAAARHLAERGVRIVACTTGSSSNWSELYTPYSDILGPQIQRLGKGHMPWDQAITYLKTLNAPPELIIDGLLGTQGTFDSLDDANATTAEEMLDWANRSKASVLAVDIPSGVNAKTGEVEVAEGEPLEVRAKIVACCGAPVVGLLKAMELRHAEQEHDWRVFICDIGINATWRDLSKGKDRIRGGKPIAFGGEWVVGVGFDAGGV